MSRATSGSTTTGAAAAMSTGRAHRHRRNLHRFQSPDRRRLQAQRRRPPLRQHLHRIADTHLRRAHPQPRSEAHHGGQLRDRPQIEARTFALDIADLLQPGVGRGRPGHPALSARPSYVNAGETEKKGVEVALTWMPGGRRLRWAAATPTPTTPTRTSPSRPSDTTSTAAATPCPTFPRTTTRSSRPTSHRRECICGPPPTPGANTGWTTPTPRSTRATISRPT